MVHDVLRSDQWRVQRDSLSRLVDGLREGTVATHASRKDVVSAVVEFVVMASQDRVPKVFVAACSVLAALLLDPLCQNPLSREEFSDVFRTAPRGSSDIRTDAVSALLYQAEAAGSSGGMTAGTSRETHNFAASPSAAAVDVLQACTACKRLLLDEAAMPLML